jgi:hypothetical protein
MSNLGIVRAIPNSEAHDLILHRHYAKRLPMIQYAFGLFMGGELTGVVTYGSPPSSTVRSGMLGAGMVDRVLELNRLCLANNAPNEASRLVGRSLRLLPTPKAVISYADTAQDHLGIVYQSTNFLYCGLSAKRTDWALRSKHGKHGQTISDMMRGVPNRAAAMREKFGDDFYLAPRSRKHRYVFFTGSKREKRDMLALLKYPITPYPKAEAISISAEVWDE